MAKILIGIIGSPKGYNTVKYSFEGKVVEDNYVLKVLKDFINPDRIVIIGTESSNWDLVDKKFDNYERLIVPIGSNQEEFWNMFEKIVSFDVSKDDEIYVDATHGFRSIPLFLITALNFLSKIRFAKIKAVYYGVFETESELKPIVDIYPIIELNDWIEAFTIYNEYKDSSKFSKLLEGKLRDSSKYQKMLETHSTLFGFTAMKQYIEYSTKIQEEFEHLASESNLKAIEFLKDDFKNISQRFSNEKACESYLELASLYFESNRFHQALVVLIQSIVECTLEKLGIELEGSERRKAESIIIKNLEENKEFVEKDMMEFMSQLADIRNAVSHAFTGRNDKPNTIRQKKYEMKELIQKAKELIKKDFIKDKEGFRKSIEKEIRKHT